MRAGTHWIWPTMLLALATVGYGQQRRLAGHNGPVRSVAYTPDGELLITAGDDGRLLFRDRPKGEVVRAFTRSGQAFSALTVADDGSAVIAGTTAGQFVHITLPDGTMNSWAGPAGHITALAISGDGRFMLSGDSAGMSRLWDLMTRTSVRELPGSQGAVTAVAFSSDGSIVSSATADGTMRAWNRESGQLLGSHLSAAVLSLAYDVKGESLVSLHADALERRWRWPPQARTSLSGHSDVVSSLALDRAGKMAVSSGHDGQVLLWDFNEGKVIRPLVGITGKLTSVGIAPDGAFAVGGNEQGVLQFWDTTGGTSRGSISGHKSAVTSLSVMPGAEQVVATYADGAVRRWRLPKQHESWAGHQGPVTHLASSLDRKVVVTCGADKSLRVWNGESGKVIRLIEALPLPPHRACVSADGQWMAWSDETGRVQIETTAVGKDSFSLQAHAGPLAGVALVDAGRLLITAGIDGSVKHWPLPLARPQVLGQIEAEVTASISLPDGHALAGDAKGNVHFLSPEGKVESVLGFSSEAITKVTRLADGTLVAADAKGRLCFRNERFGDEVRNLSTHQVPIATFAPHPTDARLATAGADGSIRIWRVPSVQELSRHEQPITAIGASVDGRLALTGDESGRVHRWNLAESRHELALSGGEAAVSATGFATWGGMATGDRLGDVRFYAEESSEQTNLLGTHDAALSRLAFHPSAPFLATAATDGRVRIWNVQSQMATKLAQTESPAAQLALASDQNRVFIAGSDGKLAAFDTNSGQQLWISESLGRAATAIAVSADNGLVALGLPTGEVHFLSSVDGAPRGVLGTGFSAVRGIAFRPGSSELSTIQDDDVVRVWKLPVPVQTWSDHAGDITHVVAARQGPLVATAATDRTVRLWNIADGTSNWILGHAQRILSLAASSDGSRVATITTMSARVWNTADGTLVREWKPLPSPGVAVTLSTDGKTLWTGHADGKLRSWNADSGESIRERDAHAQRITSLVRIGNSIASAGEDAKIHLWTLDRADCIWSATVSSPIVSLTVDPSDSFLLARDSEGKVSAWSSATGEATPFSLKARTAAAAEGGASLAFDAGKGLELHQSAPLGAFQTRGLLERFVHSTRLRGNSAFLADGQTIVSGDTKRRVVLWRRSLLAATQVTGSQAIALVYLEGYDRPTCLMRTGRIRHYDGSEAAALPEVEEVATATTTREAGRVAALGNNKLLTIWDHKQNRLIASIPLPVQGSSVSLSGNGQRAAVVGTDGVVRVWHLEPLRQLRRIGQGDPAVRAILSEAGDWIAVAYANGTVRRHLASDHAEVAAHGTGFTTCAYWPNGERLITGGADRFVRLYDRDYKPQGQIGPLDAPVQAVAVRPDCGQVLVGDGKQLYAIRADNLQVERKQEVPGGCTGIQYLGTGGQAVLACGNGTMQVIQTSDGRVLEEFPCNPATNPFGAFASPTRTVVMTAGEKNAVRFIETGIERSISGHEGPVNSLAWTEDGASLVSGGADKTVRQWNAADGVQQRIYPGHADAVTTVTVSSRAKTVFAAGADGAIRAWSLADPARQLLAIATKSPVREIKLSHDSSRVLAHCEDGAMRIYDATSGRMIEQLALGRCTSFHLTAVGEIVALKANGLIQRTAVNCRRNLELGSPKLHALTVLPNDKDVAVACDDRTVRLFDREGRQLLSLAGPPVVPTNVETDGKIIVAAGDAANSQPHVWGWDAKEGTHLFTHAIGANVVSLARSPSGRIAAGTSDRRVLVFEEGQLLQDFLLPGNAAKVVFLDDVRIAAIAGDQHIHVLHTSCECRYAGQQGPMSASALSSDGKYLFTGGNEAVLRVWGTARGKQVSAAPVPAGISQIRMSGDGSHVVVSSLDGKLLRWPISAFEQEQATTPAQMFQLPVAARALAVDATAERVIAGCEDGWARLCDLTLGKELERHGPHTAPVLATAWRPESGLFFSSAADRSLASSRLGVFSARRARQDPLPVMALSGDGRRIAGIDAGGMLVVHDSAGALLAAQQLQTKAVYRVAWSPEADEIAIAGDVGPMVVPLRRVR